MRREIRGDTKVYIEIEAKCSSGQNELNKKARIFNMLCVCVFFFFIREEKKDAQIKKKEEIIVTLMSWSSLDMNRWM